MSITYSLRRINEVCKEHVDNNFRSLPEQFHSTYRHVSDEIISVLTDAVDAVKMNDPRVIDSLRIRCDTIKNELTEATRDVYGYLRAGDVDNMTVGYVYLNMLQESQEFVTSLRKLLRASGKLNLKPSTYRSFTHVSI